MIASSLLACLGILEVERRFEGDFVSLFCVSCIVRVLSRHLCMDRRTPSAIIIEPSKELAQQTHKAVEALAEYITSPALSCGLLVGGVRPQEQLQVLERGCDIVTATLGRFMGTLFGGFCVLLSIGGPWQTRRREKDGIRHLCIFVLMLRVCSLSFSRLSCVQSLWTVAKYRCRMCASLCWTKRMLCWSLTTNAIFSNYMIESPRIARSRCVAESLSLLLLHTHRYT